MENGGNRCQELAKEMERSSDLQERLDEVVKQNPLPLYLSATRTGLEKYAGQQGDDFLHFSQYRCFREAAFQNFLMHWWVGLKNLRRSKIEKIIQDKIKLFQAEKKVDWAIGELMAYGSLLLDGKMYAWVGRRCRGTFHTVMQFCATS